MIACGTIRERKNKVIRIWAWTGAIAATLLLIAVSGFIVLRLIREQALRQQAMEAEAEHLAYTVLLSPSSLMGGMLAPSNSRDASGRS